MAFKTSADGTAASAKGVLASKSGIPAMYGSADLTTVPSGVVKVSGSDTVAIDQFGYSVAVGSGRIVVGAYGDGEFSGSAYIFDLDGTQIAKITASDGASIDRFGESVAIESSRIVVGSPQDDDNGSNSGSAYIFDLNGNQIVKITASDAAGGDQFGQSVAVGSGRIVVGAPGDDDNGSASGSAYIFDLDGTQLAKITASDGAAIDQFGYSVAVGCGRIVVGASQDDDDGPSSGSAYIFDLDGTQLTKITASDGADFAVFGYSVAVGSGRIVVGAYGDSENGNSTGAAYIFDLDGNQLAKLTASGGVSNDQFGENVAVGSGRIVVGSRRHNQFTGFANVYDLDGNLIVRLESADPETFDSYGQGVAVNSGKIIIGSVGESEIHIYDTPNVITPYDVRDWEYGY